VTNPFLGEVRMFGFGFAPKNWAQCNGQLLSIQQNAALFALLGTMYGGNGVNNFALPNLQSRVPMHRSNDGTYVQGALGGTEQVTITNATMPTHAHFLVGTTATADKKVSVGALATSAVATDYYYSPPTSLSTLNPASIGMTGGGVGHNNLQPYLVVNYCIALSGIFPSRN
jgi:microcystin-dependent protein